MRRSFVVLMATLAIVGAACTADPSDTSGIDAPGGSGIFAAGAAVTQFSSCDDFLEHVKAEAIKRVGPYGLQGHGGPYPVDVIAFEEVAEATTTAPATAGGDDGARDYSTTNVQVVGIDEPDLVKTDGDRIFVVAQGRIHWIDTTGDTPRIVASRELGGWGQQLFLNGDTLLVTTSGQGGGVEPFVDAVYPGYSERTVLTEIDVSEPGEMAVVRTLTLDGTVLSSRLIGDVARIVLRSGPVGFDWSYPEGSGIKAEREATERNKQLIEDSTIENWVPWYVLDDAVAGTSSDGPLLGCEQVGYPDEYSGLTMLSVMTVDLTEGLAPNGVGLLADGETIYASATSLYVATSPWRFWQDRSADDGLVTHIHRFDISDPSGTTYVASGSVEGVLHSQFALDEHDGVLRVVVTDGEQWRSGEVPETSVLALETLGDRLVQIGSVGGLGKNERVYSVRFIGDTAYVVTFRQVDPLYVVDLSDPRDPTVEGELKINGYSSYLHPIGEDLLLGVGQDATSEGRILGTQVSVFDVSDPANPIRMSRLTFEDAYSDAEWDHHAFLWWPEDEIVVLPLQRWSWDEKAGTEDHFAGAVVVEATTQRVRTIGEIQHPSQTEPDCEECWTWTEPVMRSVIIGDQLFTISQTGVLVSDMDSLEQQAWLDF